MSSCLGLSIIENCSYKSTTCAIYVFPAVGEFLKLQTNSCGQHLWNAIDFNWIDWLSSTRTKIYLAPETVLYNPKLLQWKRSCFVAHALKNYNLTASFQIKKNNLESIASGCIASINRFQKIRQVLPFSQTLPFDCLFHFTFSNIFRKQHVRQCQQMVLSIINQSPYTIHTQRLFELVFHKFLLFIWFVISVYFINKSK